MTEITAPKSPVTTAEFADGIREQLKYSQGVTVEQATPADVYVASSLVVRRYLQDAWFKTQQDMVNGNTKAVGYLSAEFLMGKQLRNALLNAGMIDQFDEAVKDLGFEPQDVIDVEHEPGLGNGGLGRLAACFIDSLASLGVPAFGYGIQYKYGIFEQAFDKDGKQIEKPDYWLTNEEPWGHIDYNRSQKVSFGGEVVEENGKKVWKPAWSVRAVPVDYMVPGYASGRVNTLRLWSAKSYDEFDLLTFNKSEYLDAVKQANKEDFTAYAKREYGFDLDPNTMFNTMVKRLHEYKRQSLKILALIAKYADIKSGRVSADDVLPRTVIFGAKSAPGYYLAKMTIQLINNVARVVNNDPDVKGKLHVFFPWNYNVRLAQHLIPATDLDEQLSQAGKEASGTGNMKFALNGALTVGTLDGANVEIRERVGAENFFLFGMTVDEVDKLYEDGYSPAKYYEADPRLKAAIDMVSDGTFSNGDRNTYAPLVADWLTKDWFMTLADFTAYSSIQSEIEALYRDPLEWNRKAVLNVANSGYFSSDRSIQDYLDNIWHTSPLA